MFTVDTASIIAFLVNQQLDRDPSKVEYDRPHMANTIKRPGLYVSFPVETAAWKGKDCNDPDGYWKRSHKTVVMVFTGNTSVWYSIPINIFEIPDWQQFENTSNHDSCWRSDGFSFLTQLYFDMCDKVKNENQPPRDVDSTSSWVLWAKIRQCTVTYSHKDQEYRRTLKKVEFDRD